MKTLGIITLILLYAFTASGQMVTGGQVGTTGAAGATGATGATGAGLQASSAFAGLGTPADGTIAYCTDCDPTATLLTCTHVGAQTGAFAHRVAGAWKCIG